jgi:hypothetical protein
MRTGSRTEMLTESRHHSGSNESLYIQASPHQQPLGGRRSREEGGETARKASLRSEDIVEEGDEVGGKKSATYRIVSELLPRSTRLIHEAIVESAGRPEVILEAGSLGGGQLRKHSRESSSCTCYQCQEAGFRKHSAGSAPLVHDENYNLTVPTGK